MTRADGVDRGVKLFDLVSELESDGWGLGLRVPDGVIVRESDMVADWGVLVNSFENEIVADPDAVPDAVASAEGDTSTVDVSLPTLVCEELRVLEAFTVPEDDFDTSKVIEVDSEGDSDAVFEGVLDWVRDSPAVGL